MLEFINVNCDNILNKLKEVDNAFHYDIDAQWISMSQKPTLFIKIVLYLQSSTNFEYKLNGQGCYVIENVNCDIDKFVDDSINKVLVKCIDRFINKEYEEVIKKINEIKAKFNINTNEKFDFYIKKWGDLSGSKIQNKNHLFKSGINGMKSFIQWIEVECGGDNNGK